MRKMISQEEMNKYRILIVNSDRLSQKSLYELIRRNGYDAEIANSPADAINLLEEKIFHVILANITETDYIKSIKLIKDKASISDIITLSAISGVKDDIGDLVSDCLTIPVEDRNIISSIENVLSKRPHAEEKPSLLKRLLHKEETFHDLVGKNPSMKEIYSIIERISNTKATILLRGESGTGKRVIARAIHKADKKRKDKPFVEISCGALPREIIESELFGHTRGAFTGAINDRKGRFELAHGGTVLLDDIDSFSMDLQVKLLRVLQHKEFELVGDHKTIKVDVRFIVSTNQDLEKLVAEKKFREDLYYRLNVISIFVPPLRERKDDLPLLIDHLINLYSKENHKKIEDISEETMGILMKYDWPGNVRELENIVERAVILDMDNIIDNNDLPGILVRNTVQAGPAESENAESLKDALKEPEKVYILQVMKEVKWNKKKAAKKLGVNRTTLYNKLNKYNLLSDLK